MNEFRWISLDVVTSSVVEKILMSKSKKIEYLGFYGSD